MEGECHRRFALLLLRRHKVGSPRKQECLARLASYLASVRAGRRPQFLVRARTSREGRRRLSSMANERTISRRGAHPKHESRHETSTGRGCARVPAGVSLSRDRRVVFNNQARNVRHSKRRSNHLATKLTPLLEDLINLVALRYDEPEESTARRACVGAHVVVARPCEEKAARLLHER